jgi:hypothetical protein
VDKHERSGRPAAQERGKRERADHAGERVGGDGETDEQADLVGRGDADREPGDRDGADPVAERGDAEAGQKPPGRAIREQRAIRRRHARAFTAGGLGQVPT